MTASLRAQGAGTVYGRIALFGLFAVQLALTIVIVPPWQNPDEPQHTMFALALAKHGAGILPDVYDDAIEHDIVKSLARHGWWEFYSWKTPAVLPETFEGVEQIHQQSIQGPPGYHLAAGAFLNALGMHDATAALYAMRILSALLSLGTLWCILAGTALVFGAPAGFVVAALVALHPQFAIVSTTAGPDGMVNLAGSLLWWQAARSWAGASIFLTNN